MSDEILWQPTLKQSEFLSCPAREALWGGSVGAGKTDALLMCAASQVGNGKHRALILRRQFPMLRDLIGRSHELFLPLGATYNKQSAQWTFPSGAIVEFGFLDADDDKYRYMGRAFSFIGWDELTTWPGDGIGPNGQPISSAYVYMLSRLRAVERSGLRLEVRATCTPGGVGHAWVQARWQILNDGSASEVIDPQTRFRRVFIPARIIDNPHLANTEYARALAALPPPTRKALLEGRWDIFEGAVFAEWDANVHTCAPFRVPSEWEVWRGADDGYAAPACVLWFAHDRIHDVIYVVGELYASGMTPDVMAHATREIDAQLFGLHRVIDGVIDSASFADVGMGGGRADNMNAYGCRWKPSEKGPGSRLAGVSAIHARLAPGRDDKPGMIIFRTCTNLIRTLPALTYDRHNKEDIDRHAEDHAVEALRIGLTRKSSRSRIIEVGGL